MSFCTECGARLKDKAKFCQKCGAKVSTKKLPPGKKRVHVVHRDRRFAKALTTIMVIFLLAVAGYLIYYEKSFGPGSAKKHVKFLVTEKIPTAAVVSKLTSLPDCPYECCLDERHKALECGIDLECRQNRCVPAGLT
jgi:ribosomal protein L40E